MVAVTCPTVNSYKRMGVATPNSGATWAPAYAAYGGNNRTHMLRVPEGGRIECRGVDGAANPYLAILRCWPRPGSTAWIASSIRAFRTRDNLYTSGPRR